LVVAILAAYGFSRYEFPLKRSINGAIISVQAVPPITLVIPYFGLVVALGLYNTYPGLILTHMVFTLPYAIIMTTAYFNTLPRELDESVKVDGASGWTALWRILVPISVPGAGHRRPHLRRRQGLIPLAPPGSNLLSQKEKCGNADDRQGDLGCRE
jgi:multiple sugar transport system permease protein